MKKNYQETNTKFINLSITKRKCWGQKKNYFIKKLMKKNNYEGQT